MKSNLDILHLILSLEDHDRVPSNTDKGAVIDRALNDTEHMCMKICVGGVVCVYKMTREVYPEQILN